MLTRVKTGKEPGTPTRRSDPVRSIANLIGNTPLLDLSALLQNGQHVRLLAKAEWFNPGGSVKDRAALAIFREALAQQAFSNGRRLLDASSGNTALSYAMLGAALSVKITLCVPENVSALQKSLLAAYGAQVFYTSAQEGSDGAIRMAQQMAHEYPDLYYYADQYNNPANWQAHYHTTAAEIWAQTRGRVTHFVAGLGTTGTFTGTGRGLLERNPAIKLYSVQPDSPFHGLEGLKHLDSAIVPGIYDAKLANANLSVSTEDGQAIVRRLARRHGLLVGISSGAAVAAALRVAERLTSGVVVTVLPDGAQRYMQERFWEDER